MHDEMLAVIETDGTTVELKGVVYAEQEVNTHGNRGVAIQYVEQPHQDEPDTEFHVGAELRGCYAPQVLDDGVYPSQ